MTYATRSPSAGAEPGCKIAQAQLRRVFTSELTSVALSHPLSQLNMRLPSRIILCDVSKEFCRRSLKALPLFDKAFVMTSCDMSTLFWRRSEIVCLVYLSGYVIRNHHLSTANENSLFSTLDISVDQHFMQTCLDDRRNQATVVSPYGLQYVERKCRARV